ncbi:MAG: ATP-binding protein [Desulfurivibrio sp.]|nr:ATP-binding protein [Desulfurivibrio sp.]
MERIFDPDFTTKPSGTGIGLYMTRAIIENRLGGTISCRNIGGGAEFVITLPLNSKKLIRYQAGGSAMIDTDSFALLKQLTVFFYGLEDEEGISQPDSAASLTGSGRSGARPTASEGFELFPNHLPAPGSQRHHDAGIRRPAIGRDD